MSFGSKEFVKSEFAVSEAKATVENRRANALPPLLIGGETFFNPPLVHPPVLDWLSFTASFNVKSAQADVKRFLSRAYFPDCVDHDNDEFVDVVLRPNGFLGYDHSAILMRLDPDTKQNISVGMAAWGGNGGRVYVSLNSSGCVWLQHHADILEDLKYYNAKITRLDLALDFFDGDYTVELCKKMFDEGEFVSRGGKPSHNMIGDWNDENRSYAGRSFYVGKRENGKMLRVYEKGRQLGSKHSPWVRWELELHNKDRTIPLDAFINPFPYFIGSYKALSILFGDACGAAPQYVPTEQKKAETTLENLVHYAKVSYGALVKSFVNAGVSDAEIVRLLTSNVKKSVPKRLSPIVNFADFHYLSDDDVIRNIDYSKEKEIKEIHKSMKPDETPKIDMSVIRPEPVILWEDVPEFDWTWFKG